jgi:hypothetical protein
MSQIPNNEDLSGWLKYPPKQAILVLVSDIRGHINVVQQVAEMISEDPKAQSADLSDFESLPAAMHMITKQIDQLKKLLDTVQEYPEVYRGLNDKS